MRKVILLLVLIATVLLAGQAQAACPCIPPSFVGQDSYCSQPDICRGPQDTYTHLIASNGCDYCVITHQDAMGFNLWRNFRLCSNMITGIGNCALRCAEMFVLLPFCNSSDQCSDPPSGPGGVIPERLVTIGTERWRVEGVVSGGCLRINPEDAAHATTWREKPIEDHATPHGIVSRLLKSGVRGPIDLSVNGGRTERYGGNDGAAMLRLEFKIVEGLPHATELVVCVP